MPLCPERCRAARGLLDWSQEQLAASAGVSRSTIRDFEGHRHELQRASEALVVAALEQAGVRFIDRDGEGPGVRLRQPPAEAESRRGA